MKRRSREDWELELTEAAEWVRQPHRAPLIITLSHGDILYAVRIMRRQAELLLKSNAKLWVCIAIAWNAEAQALEDWFKGDLSTPYAACDN